jgi:hypothetical protein
MVLKLCSNFLGNTSESFEARRPAAPPSRFPGAATVPVNDWLHRAVSWACCCSLAALGLGGISVQATVKTGRNCRSLSVCASISFGGGTPHFSLVRTNRKERGTMSETYTHSSLRKINLWIGSRSVLANNRTYDMACSFSAPVVPGLLAGNDSGISGEKIVTHSIYTMMSFTTVPATSVRRKSRPL